MFITVLWKIGSSVDIIDKTTHLTGITYTILHGF